MTKPHNPWRLKQQIYTNEPPPIIPVTVFEHVETEQQVGVFLNHDLTKWIVAYGTIFHDPQFGAMWATRDWVEDTSTREILLAMTQLEAI